jgi:hypothetical protein
VNKRQSMRITPTCRAYPKLPPALLSRTCHGKPPNLLPPPPPLLLLLLRTPSCVHAHCAEDLVVNREVNVLVLPAC